GGGRAREKSCAVARDRNHLRTRRDYPHRTARDEHAEAPVARTGEESRAAYRDQREGAANNRRGRLARRPIEQQWPGAKRHFPAGIDKKPIDLQSRLLAKPDHRIAAEPHSQPGCGAGRDFVAEKDWRGRIERAASRVELGERLTLDVLDRADSLGGARRHDGKDERERRRSLAEKPASTAGPVAFDLADVGHRRSPSARCSREQCLSVVVSLKRYVGLGGRIPTGAEPKGSYGRKMPLAKTRTLTCGGQDFPKSGD